MPKSNNIKWREIDQKKLSNTVRKFNAKRTRLIKIVPELEEILPKKVNVQNIKSNIKTRNDFNKSIASLERFMKKGAEKVTVTKSGVRTTKYQLDELKIQHRIINLQRKAKRKEAKVSTSKGTMGSINTRHLTPKKNNSQNIPKNMWQNYIDSVQKQIYDTYYEGKSNMYRDNYFKAVMINLGEDFANELREITNNISNEDFYKAYYANPDLQPEFYYSMEEQEMKKTIVLNAWNDYIEELKEGLL